jgi:pyruvate dehydrogenase E2 component (dihydrolipoyllysine-residue acetyltransferase)
LETFVAEFKIPNLGENVTSGDVLRVMVKAGDTIAKDQPVLELETDKATIEVPSSVAGKVTEIKVQEGEKVTVGQVILVVEDGGAAEASTPAAAAKGAQPERVESAKPAADRGQAAEQEEKEKKTASRRSPEVVAPAATGADEADEPDEPDEHEGLRQRVPGEVRAQGATDKPGEVEEDVPRRPARAGRAEVVDISRGARGAVATAAEAAPARDVSRPAAPAAPSVRRLARELGIDINSVPGSGPGGRISADDVMAHGKRIITGAVPAASGRVASAAVLPDFTKWGDVERKPMRGVRRKTAEHLTVAWTTIPHVTQCDQADITALEELRAKYGKRAEAAGGKLTVTAIALKVVATALKVFPQFNSSIDMEREELVYKKYCHVGIAVDTDRGLLVPVIRDVDRKNIIELAAELSQAAEKARNKKLTLEDMEGGSFTITNLGGIGGTYFTPIINYPEVAILGISRAQMEPVYADGAFQPRLRLPLSLSYDHRVIDGADGIRFLRFVVEALEQPFLLSLQG